jgi:hypothetical protein
MSMIRTRWAAVGAAVAVTLGAGGIGLVDATKDSGFRPVTVTLDEPCRLVDTRADKGIGGRTTPIGEGEVHTITATGPSGNCNVPGDALGLIGNATAVNASENTNLRLYPADASGYPQVSNLNPRPGAPPTPNGFTVGLSGIGEFNIRNAKGSVDVIVDVAAYLVHHTHSEYDDTEAAIDGADVTGLPITTANQTLISEKIEADRVGYIVANATVSFLAFSTDGRVTCSLSLDGSVDGDASYTVDIDANELDTMSITRGFELPGPVFLRGASKTVSLACTEGSGDIRYYDPAITLILVADDTEPGGWIVPQI